MERNEQIDAIVERVLAENQEVVQVLEGLSPGIKDAVRLSIRLWIAHVAGCADAEGKSYYADIVFASAIPSVETVDLDSIQF